jgi:hypothetical protein
MEVVRDEFLRIWPEFQWIKLNERLTRHAGELIFRHALKGCTYFCHECKAIAVENVIEKARNRILYRLNKFPNNNFGSEIRVYAPCPSERFPEKNKKGKEIKRSKVELFACNLAFSDADIPTEQRNTAILFAVNDELERQGLCIQTVRTNILNVNPDDGSMTILCPKLPKDLSE